MRIAVNKLYEGKFNYRVYLVYCLILLALSFLINQTVLTKEFYFNSLGNMQKETIEQMIEIKQEWSWLSYVLIPVKLTIKICMVGLVLKIGFIFIHSDIKYNKLLNVAIISEIIYILYSCISTIYALGIKSFEELQNIPSLSLYSLLSHQKVPSYLNYLCRNLSLAEVIYWFLLAYGLSIITSKKYLYMLKFVLSSYVPLLFFWLLIVSYCSLNSF